MAVRNAVTSTRLAERLVDSQPETFWQAFSSGDTASFLLEQSETIDAEVVVQEEGEPASYEILSSSNYRDWTLRSESVGEVVDKQSDLRELEPFTARYVRFRSLHDQPVAWSMQMGERAQVADWLLGQKPVNWGDITDPEVIAGLLDLAFGWQQANPTSIHEGKGWITGTFYSGVSALYETTRREKYRQAILRHGNESGWTLHDFNWGKTYYHADNQCIGQTWLELYLREEAPQSIWIADLRARLERIMANPLPGREDYSWCDALYMGPPNYVRLAAITGENRYLSFMDRQWWDSVDYLYDRDYHLFYRDDNFFGSREPNDKPVFWSRGNGWVMGGTVRILQYLPDDWPNRDDYIDLLKEMSAAVASVQGDEGLWGSSLLYPEKFGGERETSGSAFFTYAMAWGVNEGILDGMEYGPVIEKAWAGLTGMLTAAGTLQFIQQQGAEPAAANAQLTDKDYGYGAFLLAGTEMMRYYAGRTGEYRAAAKRAEEAEPPGSGGPADWQLVEDFEDDFGWTVRTTLDAEAQLVPALHDPGGSKVFSLNSGNRREGVYRATTSMPAIPEGGTATVYQRFCYTDPEIDVVFGVSDRGVVDAYDDYENGLRIYESFNQLEARAGSEYVIIGKDLLQLETWYEVWTVIDNESDTYDVYLRGGSNYPERQLVQSDLSFRNGRGSGLISYAVSYNGALSEGTFLLDDLYIDPEGSNLTRPERVAQPVYSPWAEVGRDPKSMGKETGSGWLWDDNFPWIYVGNPGSWAYAISDLNEWGDGLCLWQPEKGSWIWLPFNAAGWHYDFESQEWVSPL